MKTNSLIRFVVGCMLAYLFLLLVGCNSAKQAARFVNKALSKDSATVAKITRSVFPCITVKSDTTYHTIDTVMMIDCPTGTSEYFTVTDTLNRVDTLYKDKVKKVMVTLPIRYITITKNIEDSAKMKVVVSQAVGLQAKVDKLQMKLDKRNKWLMICGGLLMIIGVVWAVRVYGRITKLRGKV